MAGGTIQHPVIIDKATSTRLGYGSSCILGPSRAALVPEADIHSDGVGEQGPENIATKKGNLIPELGGSFRMWSDYRMALEGEAKNVQAGTLFAPVLDVARTAADSFRRRWASGGQYPERSLARVQLAERENAGGDGSPPSPRPDGGRDRSDIQSAVSPLPDQSTSEKWEREATNMVESNKKGTPKRHWKKLVGHVSRTRVAGSVKRGGGIRSEGDVTNKEEGGGLGGDSMGAGSESWAKQRGSDHQQVGLQRVLSRLDGLDDGILVERALEDLQGEEEHKSRLSSSPPQSRKLGGKSSSRLDSANGANSNLHADVHSNESSVDDSAFEIAPAVSTASTVTPGPLSETLGSSGMNKTTGGTTPVPLQDEVAVEMTELIGSGHASPEGSEMRTPTADRFLLPSWHYLALSGRSLSIDVRWTHLELILMQDPTAKQGRDSGKNVLALRSSGALTLRSSGSNESVNVQLEKTSLLPCFYTDRDSEERGDDRIETALTAAASSATPLPRRKVGKGDTVCEADAARRLTLLLGGGSRSSSAVSETWLGQGLMTADSMPLLEPFTAHFRYETVVTQAAQAKHGGNITDGQRMVSGQDSDDDMEQSEEEEEEEKSEEERNDRKAVEPVDTEMVSGVFRVAVSELQVLLAQARLKGSATVEVEVRFFCVSESPWTFVRPYFLSSCPPPYILRRKILSRVVVFFCSKTYSLVYGGCYASKST